MTAKDEFGHVLSTAGVYEGRHVLVHASFRAIRSAFPDISIGDVVGAVEHLVTPLGSLIIPSFSYCYKRSNGEYTAFLRDRSPSAVGAVSEAFRLMPGVVRTSSPTHSFSLWGKAAAEIGAANCPASPLGEGSVLDWMARKANSLILMLGTDFSSFSFGHYLEMRNRVPWCNFSPWGYLGILPIGVSEDREIPIRENPGCSRSFVTFESYLLEQGIVEPHWHGEMRLLALPVPRLLEAGEVFFVQTPELLLCPKGTCKACDSRRRVFLEREG